MHMRNDFFASELSLMGFEGKRSRSGKRKKHENEFINLVFFFFLFFLKRVSTYEVLFL